MPKALSGIAGALAGAGRVADAERLAGGITDDYFKAQALTGIAQALAGAGQVADAERICIDHLLGSNWPA